MLHVYTLQSFSIIIVVDLVGRSAPIGVSQLNTMPLDLKV